MVNQIDMNAKLDRQRKVLELIVKHHVMTALPVGSLVIAKEMGLSSATIRNIMFELEDAGLIRQPHTSAGRIPTEKGYRIYVDMVMESADFSAGGNNRDEGEALVNLRSGSIEDVLLRGLELCSRVTAQTCIAFLPATRIRQRFFTKESRDGAGDIMSALYDLGDRFYLDGAHYLVEQPEFKAVEKIGAVLKILENKKGLLEILEENVNRRGIKVYIGSENKGLGFDECSMVTANYTVEDDIFGTLGIIGPMRMEYERIIPAVVDITGSLSRLLSEMV